MSDRSVEFVPLCEAPTGIFRTLDGAYGFKTEYRRDDKSIDAYCLDSGEAWWGDAPQSVERQRAQLVFPVDFDAMRATHAALVAKAAERDRLTTCGVAELAAMNPNLASYCREWESRAELAEAKERPEIVNAINEILRVREERDAAVARGEAVEKAARDMFARVRRDGCLYCVCGRLMVGNSAHDPSCAWESLRTALGDAARKEG